MNATRASHTAEYMALFRAVETALPASRRLFEDRYAAAFLPAPLRLVAAIARLPLVGRSVTWALDAGWPRTRSSGVVRTRYIDDEVRGALAAGARQLLLLGAGFDSRAHRLPEAAAATVFEVDHPATQSAKRSRLSRLPHADVRFVAVDFERDDLETALAAAGYDPAAVAGVLWEGVLSYLTAAAVDRTFALLQRLTAPGSRLIFTYVHQGAIDGSVHFAEAERWQRWVRRGSEPFTFGFDPAALPRYLAGFGFALRADLSTAEIARRQAIARCRHEPGSDLYRVAVAERA